jgi:adenosyl cobinamide kinase/adenosyl cobinamide phosphate guanylyltransferase
MTTEVPTQSTKKCFIVISHFRQKKGSWQTTEEAEVTNSLKPRHLSSASIIIDVLSQTFVKNRFQADSKLPEEDHLAYLAKYIHQFKKEITSILKKQS